MWVALFPGFVQTSVWFMACACCGASRQHAELFPCSSCRNAVYCGRSCQKEHWRNGGHRESCSALREAPRSEPKPLRKKRPPPPSARKAGHRLSSERSALVTQTLPPPSPSLVSALASAGVSLPLKWARHLADHEYRSFTQLVQLEKEELRDLLRNDIKMPAKSRQFLVRTLYLCVCPSCL